MDLDDIVGNVETIERLKVIARDGNMPHIIISVWTFSHDGEIGTAVMVGNAGDWEDDECDGFGACVVGGCVQGGSPGTECFG